MNGTLVMQSKDPFEYQGLSVSAQSGMMNIDSYSIDKPTPMTDLNLRYAKHSLTGWHLKLQLHT